MAKRRIDFGPDPAHPERISGGDWAHDGRSRSRPFAHWDRLLTELGEWVEPKMLEKICRDPDDDKFLEAALGGKADILISGDQDLLSLVNIQEIPIVSPAKAIKSYLE